MSERALAKVQTQQKMPRGLSSQSSLLRRACACSQHTIAGGECSTCRNERSTLLHSQRAPGGPPLAPFAVQGDSPAQENVPSLNSAFNSAFRFGHDFSRIPVYSSHSPVLQTKLTVNQPGDVYEREADQVAEQVMRMVDSPLSDEKGEARNALMREQSKKPGADATIRSPDAPPIVHTVLNGGGGQPLDTTTRAFMEPRFGHDFSQVRVHSDERAAESARSVNALAYTVGRDVVFETGQYVPGTGEGRKLLAHELTHVLQQTPRSGKHFRSMTQQSVPFQQLIPFSNVSNPLLQCKKALSKGERLKQKVIQDLQKNHKTLTGIKIKITGDLIDRISAEATQEEPRMAKKHRKAGYKYSPFEGERFIRGRDPDDPENVDPNDVKQGQLGDCYLFAAMAAVAAANPQAIRDLIQLNPDGDGTYDVTLYIQNDEWQEDSIPFTIKHVKPTFPADKKGKPIYGKLGDIGTEGGELWAMLIEKAYAIYKGGYQELIGGSTEDAVPMLTKGARTESFDPADERPEKIGQKISEALKKHWPVTAGTKSKYTEFEYMIAQDPTKVFDRYWNARPGENPKTIAKEIETDRRTYAKEKQDHFYVPIAVNESEGTIDLRNPWGTEDLKKLPLTTFRLLFDVYTITYTTAPDTKALQK